jgi:ATP-dependent DNA helicase RecG
MAGMAGREDDFLQTPVRYLKGVGPARAEAFAHAGLNTVEDLLFRFPLRYEDREHFVPVARVRAGEWATVFGEIVSCHLRLTRRRGFKIFQALVRDESGVLPVVWMNQPFMRDVLRPHQLVVLHGKVAYDPRGVLQLERPDHEVVTAEDRDTGRRVHFGRIVPVYEKIGNARAKLQRALVYEAVRRLAGGTSDPLPDSLRASFHLPDRATALADTHFPPPGTALEVLRDHRTPAQHRLIFEEFFLFQLGMLLRRRESDGDTKPFVPVPARAHAVFKAVMPFRPTPGQRQAMEDIAKDMGRAQPMNRLLQGDVGAGKTLVALAAATIAMENGLQVAFMAPTEILAQQHYLTIGRLLEATRFSVKLLTGATPAGQRREILNRLANGSVHFVVGTHALIEEDVTFHRLGLAIVDEQHRFGVVQRAALRRKGLRPDVLVMTATPIPRTLALTAYGDLDVSVIRDLPPGRQPIRTYATPDTARDEVYRFLRAQVEAGRQAYVIYPLVEGSEKVDLKAATEMADHLAHDVFPQFRVALLHGRMKQDVKDRVMRAFAAGAIDLLVATTVVEVGVDVANATAMVIEHAERFGLSQLHQLRGRVGRGRHQSSCFLLYQAPLTEDAEARLRAMRETTDGFVIAERDLQVRGPGDLFGTRQSGLPTLRVVDLLRDGPIMESAREAAQAWVDRGGETAERLRTFVRRTWAERFRLAGVG